MSRQDPNYDPELAKQIMANVKAGRAGAGAPPPLTPGGILRRFFNVGFIGSEPFEARRPVARSGVPRLRAIGCLVVLGLALIAAIVGALLFLL